MSIGKLRSTVRSSVFFSIILLVLGVVSFAFSDIVSSFDKEMGLSAKTVSAASTPEKRKKSPFNLLKTDEKPLGGANGKLIFGSGVLDADFDDLENGLISSIEPAANSTPTVLAAPQNIEPAWSPDGKKIVFVSTRDGLDFDWSPDLINREIYIMNADGTSQRRLTYNLLPEAQPVFSPDGTKILYVRAIDENNLTDSAVYSMNLDGTNQTMLFDESCFLGSAKTEKRPRRENSSDYYPGIIGLDTPNYSPDQSKIVFGWVDEVYRYDVASGTCSLFATSTIEPTEPRYSPDGSKIAYLSAGIVIRDAANGNFINEIFAPNHWQSPVWSPDATKLAYLGTSNSNFGSDQIWTYNLTNNFPEMVYFPAAGSTLFSGLSWGTPSPQPPPISLSFSPSPWVLGGQSLTGIVQMDPAIFPAGGTINLSVAGAAGTIVLPQTTVTIPPGQTSGTFTISAAPQTVYNSADVIATYLGNTTRATVTIRPPKPDLSVDTVTAPATVTVGAAFSVSWTLKNLSTTATYLNYRDEVFFSTDSQWDASDPLLVTVNNSSLAGNAQRTLTRSVTVNQSHQPQNGQNYLIVVSNRNRNIDEDGAYANNTFVKAIQINLPDVVAENLTAPAEIEPNVNYNFSYTIRNAGGGATGTSFTNQLYFSENQTIGDADDFLIDSFTQTAMTAGQTATRNVTNKKIPTVPARADGQALIYVKVDSNANIAEGAGETNNTTGAVTQFFYRVPDLQVTAANAPPEVDSDTVFAMDWMTANTGNKPAGAFTDKVYFSLDNQVGADVEIGSFPLASGLDAGASANRIQNVTIPTSALTQTGNYFVYVKTDTSNVIDEGVNENNNVRFQPVRVRRLLRPDLTITNITAPDAAFFDQTIQVQWTVTNSGQGPTNAPQWKDKVFLHTAPTTSSSRLVAAATSISALNAGESYTASATFKIPRGYNGAYLFTVKTDTDGVLNEENTANNTLTRPVQINVPPLPDLIVENVQVPSSEAFAGQELLVSYAIKNQGTGAAAGWRDRVYLSRDTTLNTSQDRLIFTTDGFDSTGLGANQTVNLTTRNRIPRTYNPVQYTTMRLPSDVSGLWYVFVVTDYNNSVYEFNDENNNTDYDRTQPGAPLNILVTPPDLVVPAAPSAPPNATSGQSIGVDFTIKNQGAFNAAPNLYHAVYLSTDQTFDPNDTLLGTLKDPDFFAPAGEHPLTLNVRLPDCLANGTYYLFAVADYDSRQYEFDPGYDAEANNASPPKEILLATAPPDLLITDLQFSPVTAPGQTVSLNWTVTNMGAGAASGSWSDRVVLNSTNPEIPPVQLALVEHEGGLAAGASYTPSVNVGLPAYMEGEYFLSVTTDYRDSVAECGASESNNAANSSAFTVQNNLPDLVIDAVSIPASVVAGENFTVQWTGRNANGAMPAGAPKWTDKVYLSTDQTLSNSDYLIGSGLNQAILAGGETYPQQAQVKTGNVPAGTYHILIVADAGKHIYEGAANTPPETNNMRASAPITVTTPAVDLQVANVLVAPPFYSGTNMNISWTVTNFGATDTLGTNWSDYVILSRDLILDSTDQVLGYKARSAPLPGGASYTAAANFFVPNGLTGDYNIFVITDRSNKIIESNNDNNTSPPFAVDLTLTPPADLNVTNVAPPVTVNPGENASFNWTVQNSGPNAVLGKWRDTVYLSQDTFWDSSDVFVGQRELDSLTTPVAPGATYTTGTSLTLPPIEEGTYYVIVRTDAQNRIRESNEANNVSSATAVTTVTITELPINTPYNTALGNGALKYLKFTPQPLETIRLSLTTDILSRSNELLTNFGSVVSRADYDFQGDQPGEANQQNFIPETGDGSYYSLVRTDFIPESFAPNFDKTPAKSNGVNPTVPSQNVTVKAETLPFSIREISPTIAGNQGATTLVIEGAKFKPGATVKLVGANSQEITPAQTRVSSSRIAAIFDLREKPAGVYDVLVRNPDGEATTLAAGFKIVSGGGHSLRQSIVGPRSLRVGASTVRYTVSAHNDGLNDALSVPIVIALPAGMNYDLDRSNFMDTPAGLLPADTKPSDIPVHFDRDGARFVFLVAPVVRSRSSVTVNINLHPPAFSGFRIQLAVLPPLHELLSLGLENPQDPAQAFAKMRLLVPNVTEAEACWLEYARQMFFATLGLFGPADECLKAALGVGTFIADLYSGIALDHAVGDGKLEPLDIAGIGAGRLLALVNQIVVCAGKSVPWIEFAGYLLTTVQLSKQLYDCLDKTDDYFVDRPTALDPNEKLSPEGYGAERFVPVKKPMLYRINFENVATASAPAQRIYITDVLPPTLDPRTVRLKEIGFKQNRIEVPENRSFYQARIQLGEDLNNLTAGISAGLDLINNQIFWTLTAIDPQTGERPDDPLVGLLPPNNENHDGEGYVTFTIEPKTTLPSRTEISNFATIFFDENEPIVTNTTANLLDSVVPSSRVEPLSATSPTTDLNIDWTATDDADGSGFRLCEIRVSEAGGSYLPLLTSNTPAGSGIFSGKWGKTYRFYSIASDNAGNIELPPDAADATVTILGGDTEGDVAPRPNGSDGQISVGDVTQIRRFAGGLDTDFLYNEFQRADAAPLDTFGNGAISTADIVQARRFAAGLDQPAEAAGPNAAAAPFISKTIGGKNTLTLPRELRPVRVNRTGNKVTVGVELEAQGDEVGVGFTLNFDPAVLSNPANVSLGAGAGGAALTVNSSQAALGRLGIIVDRAPDDPFAAGVRQLITVEFDIAAGNPQTATLGFGNSPVLSEVVDGSANTLTTVYSSKTISLLAPTAASVAVAGQVFTSEGNPVIRANVRLTDARGISRTASTNTFGNFRFNDVPSGQIYVVSVSAKGFEFNPQVVNVTDAISDLIFTSNPR